MFVKSIRFKNIILFMIILSFSFSIIGLFIYSNLEKRLYSNIDGFLIATAVSVSDSIDLLWEKEKYHSILNNTPNKTLDDTIHEYFFKIIRSWVSKDGSEDPKFLNILVQVYDNKGKIIFSSKKLSSINKLTNSSYKKLLKGTNIYENITLDSQDNKTSELRFLSHPIMYENKLSYIIRVAISLSTMSWAMTNLRLILFIMFPLTIILSGIFALILTNNTLNPINKMINSINQITAKNLKFRIDIPESKDEIRKLAETFNIMIDRLDGVFSSQQHLIEELSHEIKTPLSVMKGQTEVAIKRDRSETVYRDILKSNLEEINRIIRITENLLLISQFESKAIEINFKQIELKSILQNIYNDIKIIAEKKDIMINFNAKNHSIINGDENQIKSLFLNLIDNAIKYTNNNGKIDINLSRQDNFARIEISDTGIGIPEEDLPFIFNRFYRAVRQDKEKGFGLGLSIVKSIVDMNNGKINVTSKLGKGTTFHILLPLID